MCQPFEQSQWDHASFSCQTVVQRVQEKDHCPMSITHPCLQLAYGWDWSFWHAGRLVQDHMQPGQGDGTFPSLDTSIANFWLVYKKDCGLLNEKAMPLKRFRLAVAHSLNQVNKPASKVGRPSSSSPPPPKKHYTPRPSLPKPQPDVRYDSLGHWPLHCDKRGRCNYCPKGVSRWKCQKCNVFLCLNANQECFAAYHQK